MKCVVKDCENHSHEGKFVGSLCSPCHEFISGEGGLYSQAYRNTRSMIDLAIAREREACAQVCIETGATRGNSDAAFDMADHCAAAIRARVDK
jgi:hypothetical protein